ncbi:hypothetical protein F9C07_2284265 [Aspergillus flavus]|uniref:Protein kinase domain-containing protein n=1 Tax=Aspergillus flavus (strain ATCC 200026 / FGSC A1120 / IAM 13836 / NRRL 3357 / JCM 12722 / SRRC 167) TaxID=332952 RepID=A0A7U2QSN0_ASPFN|nr:uncharacterized protein G4B84_007493 [Aspergillus flavus NRRL3357]KAF7617330.1 hypothetical protein AFLA_005371 [Aspergillus flavus NRRL3357]QMW32062.1 hypothetical protein G4B84_007493 [Aspergillus flavus NRRL3357]QRD83471.1 hypothetical protein F9C07_2284265 [Aspergillus flavus]
MAAQRPLYAVDTFVSSTKNTDTQLNVFVSDKLFKIDLFATNFKSSPALLAEYLRQIQRQDPEFIPDPVDDEWGDPLEEMSEWILQPFLPIFRKVTPLDTSRQYTLDDCFFAEEFSYTVQVVEETLVPVYLGKGLKLQDIGACLPSVQHLDYSMFPVYRPSEVQVPIDPDSTALSGRPRKVFIPGRSNPSFLKLVYTGHTRSVLKELIAYSKIHMAKLDNTVRTCRLDGLVQDGHGQVMGLLLSYINRLGSTLECFHPQYDGSRQKWFDQIAHTVKQLHTHNIIWGDAKAANVLIDPNGDAYLIDFGGSYTKGWVPKELADTIDGDLHGLENIRRFLLE